MSLEIVNECPACGNQIFTNYITCQDYLVSNQQFQIQQCSTCTLLLTNPRPDVVSIGHYYKSQDYISHTDGNTGLIDQLYRTVRTYTLRQKVNLIDEVNKGKGSMLDVGCGTGSFLEQCQAAGWEVSGVEPDPDAQAIAEKRLQKHIKENVHQIEVRPPFDVITMWHVLEHIPLVNESLKQIHSLLRPGGTLIIAVPNCQSWDAEHYMKWWAAYDVPRHLYHFSPTTLRKLVEKNGFNEVGRRPMLFDSFYIAMLSTKNRDGKTNYAESVINGLKSNFHARRTGNYSSLTYVFQRQ
ncbi:class I SAM-dependent methyltransferase [Nibrella saemangeumensis]|uniref:Class I SAM-dependent methyltransferase n=1 Tax=Nibrella saemangeumensis TaxID=1084526 RepID=A0ABP8MYW0_9BACT